MVTPQPHTIASARPRAAPCGQIGASTPPTRAPVTIGLKPASPATKYSQGTSSAASGYPQTGSAKSAPSPRAATVLTSAPRKAEPPTITSSLVTGARDGNDGRCPRQRSNSSPSTTVARQLRVTARE